MTTPKIAAIILAAGQSRRLGRPKQTLPFRASTLLSHSIHASNIPQIHETIVVLGFQHDLISKHIPKTKIIYNEDWHLGMGSSIIAGVKHCKLKNYDGIVISVADQPHLNQTIFDALMHKIDNPEMDIITSKYLINDGPPTYFGKHYFDELLDISPSKGAKPILKKYKSTVEYISFPDGHIDIDRPDDLQHLH